MCDPDFAIAPIAQVKIESLRLPGRRLIFDADRYRFFCSLAPARNGSRR